jgi:Uncharacterised nucleotidyltransferase
MPEEGLPPPLIQAAVRNLLIDRLTAEVGGMLAEAGIDCMVVKGPVIHDSLYHDTVRPYGDCDLFVARADWERAVAVLANHGFQDHLGPMAHPRMESLAGTAFVRGSDNVDLHCTLAGLDAPPDDVWNALWKTADRQQVGGREMAIPSRPAMLMHLALHAAHHTGGYKPSEDLRRGIELEPFERWRQAAQLAKDLSGIHAFAYGLRQVPEGVTLVRELGLEKVRSVEKLDVRAADVPMAEGLNELIRPGLSLSRRASIVVTELFPNPAFMRWRSSLARRGPIGLALSYPLRWAWLAVHFPAGLAAVRRARGGRGT